MCSISREGKSPFKTRLKSNRRDCGGLAFLLDQRSKVDDRLQGIKRLDLTAKAAAMTLLSEPLLARKCKAVPEPKSLSNREYVKWKAQARI